MSIVEFPKSNSAIRALHSEIERLATFASQSYINQTPIRIGHDPCDHSITLHYWFETDLMKVFTADGSVFIEGGHRMEYSPDWLSLSNVEARELANALLSAAAHVSEREDGDL